MNKEYRIVDGSFMVRANNLVNDTTPIGRSQDTFVVVETGSFPIDDMARWCESNHISNSLRIRNTRTYEEWYANPYNIGDEEEWATRPRYYDDTWGDDDYYVDDFSDIDEWD